MVYHLEQNPAMMKNKLAACPTERRLPLLETELFPPEDIEGLAVETKLA